MRKKTFLIVVGILIALFAIVSIFFVVTSTMSQPTTMKLNVSGNSGHSNFTNADVHVIIVSSQKIIVYATDINQAETYSIKPVNSFRDYLARMKQKHGDSIVAVLKPLETATYQAAVDALDEMTINHIKKFELTDPTEEEKKKFLSTN